MIISSLRQEVNPFTLLPFSTQNPNCFTRWLGDFFLGGGEELTFGSYVCKEGKEANFTLELWFRGSFAHDATFLGGQKCGPRQAKQSSYRCFASESATRRSRIWTRNFCLKKYTWINILGLFFFEQK